MASLDGIYRLQHDNQTEEPTTVTLEITGSNNRNGSARGVFTHGEMRISVDIHYHFKNSRGPETTLRFWGSNDDPNQYVGGAGSLPNNADIFAISLTGGLATLDVNHSFHGVFRKDR